MANLYKFVHDETSSLFKVYDGDIFLQDIPYFAYGSSFVFFNANFSIACCGLTFIDIIYHYADSSTIKNYSFDFSGIFNAVEVGTYFDLGVWDNSYALDLFWVTKNILGAFQSLNEVNMTFDQTTLVATGLTFGSVVPAPATCDLTLLTPEFNEIDLSIATLDEKLVSLHQKVDYLVTVLGQVYTLEQTLATKTDLAGITFDTTSLATKTDISALAHYDVTNINLPSLNGNGSEFKDGLAVTVFGRETVYTVERSYMSLYANNAYTIHYDLVSLDGFKCSVPESLLTKQVVAV